MSSCIASFLLWIEDNVRTDFLQEIQRKDSGHVTQLTGDANQYMATIMTRYLQTKPTLLSFNGWIIGESLEML